jgi:pyruvate dehydrogenase kinase 2/3/4
VKELDELPHNLGEMKSMQKVKNWYAQSFEVSVHSIPNPYSGGTITILYSKELINFPQLTVSPEIRQALVPTKQARYFPPSQPNPSITLPAKQSRYYPPCPPNPVISELGAEFMLNGHNGDSNQSSYQTGAGSMKLRVPLERR